MSYMFAQFARTARERAAAGQPAAPSFSERVRAINEEFADPSERRLEAVQRLAEQGSTEGERAAARAAVERLTGGAGDESQGFGAV
jgi:hypothetical protein